MKTFKDIVLECETPDLVLKSYFIGNKRIAFTADQLSRIITGTLHIVEVNSTGYPEILGTVIKVGDTLVFNASQQCEECHGKGEIVCDICYGSGEHECFECECEHECGKCNGDGVLICELCGGNEFDETKILLHDVIDLTQGELF